MTEYLEVLLGEPEDGRRNFSAYMPNFLYFGVVVAEPGEGLGCELVVCIDGDETDAELVERFPGSPAMLREDNSLSDLIGEGIHRALGKHTTT